MYPLGRSETGESRTDRIENQVGVNHRLGKGFLSARQPNRPHRVAARAPRLPAELEPELLSDAVRFCRPVGMDKMVSNRDGHFHWTVGVAGPASNIWPLPQPLRPMGCFHLSPLR